MLKWKDGTWVYTSKWITWLFYNKTVPQYKLESKLHMGWLETYAVHNLAFIFCLVMIIKRIYHKFPLLIFQFHLFFFLVFWTMISITIPLFLSIKQVSKRFLCGLSPKLSLSIFTESASKLSAMRMDFVLELLIPVIMVFSRHDTHHLKCIWHKTTLARRPAYPLEWRLARDL